MPASRTIDLPRIGETQAEERQSADPDIWDGGFPPDPDDWASDKKVCQYFNADDETEICTTDPEYFIRGYCWDPGCDEIHTWYYCLRHYASNIGSLLHYHCKMTPSQEIVWYMREGDLPPRYQLIEWGRIGEEGENPLPDPYRDVRPDPEQHA